MPTAEGGPSVAMSFANNFWGKEDAGVTPLLERMHAAKATNDELRSFYAARASIEDDYSRKLLSLCRKPLGSQELGSLRGSLDTVRAEVESMAKQHQSIAAQMKSELEEPLAAFAGAMKERRKIVQNGIEKLLKVKVQQTQTVNKTRDRYEQDCLKVKGYLAQGHMVMGQEERKNKARLEKTQISLATTNADYEAAVKVLEETTGRWNREWKAAADKFQDLEEERLDFAKSSLWTFANIASTVCVSDDASCEKVRLSLEKMEVEKDISTFITTQGTGQEIPDPPKYINFCRGDIADTHSDTSDDEGYSVAQFPRSINPAFRTSSPQPSTYESHHDPNSALARDLAHAEPTANASREATLTPQKTTPQRIAAPAAPHAAAPATTPSPLAPASVVGQSAGNQPKPSRYHQQQPVHQQEQLQQTQQTQQTQQMQQYYEQPQPLAVQPLHPSHPSRPSQPSGGHNGGHNGSRSSGDRQRPARHETAHHSQSSRTPIDPSQHGEFAPVPHEPYPLDGMTMLCRPGPPSERSSHPTSARPSSRDSQSDISNATSFSSQEPQTNGKVSPVKKDPPREDKHMLRKKKSGGFFNSPFRRKSTKDVRNTQSARNTWHSNSGPAESKPQHRRPQLHQEPAALLHDRDRGPSPEPIDANASLALNVGHNVFPVSTKSNSNAASPPNDAEDPIALALAELKEVTMDKNPSRISADHYHGIATPAPGNQRPSRVVPVPGASSGARATPPPSYDTPPQAQTQVQRLGVPPPAVTSKAMKDTSQRYTEQARNVCNSTSRTNSPGTFNNAPSPRPSSRGYNSGSVRQVGSASYTGSISRSGTRGNDMPRATSPAPPRSVSPHHGMNERDSRGSQRSRSPNPSTARPFLQHHRASSQASVRTRGGSRSEHGGGHGGNSGSYSRYASPHDAGRDASPAPGRDYGRPGSSQMNNDMAMQLAPSMDDGGSQRGRSNGRPGTSQSSRGMSLYDGGGTVSRPSSRSVGETGRQYTPDGCPILHFARAQYMYQAAIPEELGFSKGDTLAILRHQDDGWWEAEVQGGGGRGLVPSNYLQVC